MQGRSALLILLMAAPLALAQAPGRVNGAVHDSAGRPLAGVAVSILARPPSTHQFGAQTRSANDGSFSFASVPAGEYELCAIPATGSDFLNPCLSRTWDAPRDRITVQSGAAATAKALVLTRGVRVQIRVNDPQGLVRQHDSQSKSELGVHTSALLGVGYAPAALVEEGPAHRVYEVIAAPGSPLAIAIRSRKFEVADGSNNKVNTLTGAPASVAIPAGASRHVVVYSVTGLRPEGK